MDEDPLRPRPAPSRVAVGHAVDGETVERHLSSHVAASGRSKSGTVVHRNCDRMAYAEEEEEEDEEGDGGDDRGDDEDDADAGADDGGILRTPNVDAEGGQKKSKPPASASASATLRRAAAARFSIEQYYHSVDRLQQDRAARAARLAAYLARTAASAEVR